MFLILFLALFKFFLSFSLGSNYAGFHNLPKTITIDIKYNESESSEDFKIYYYSNNISEYEENKCTINQEDNNFNCTFNKNGTFSLIINNTKYSSLSYYNNFIILYNQPKLISSYSFGCFVFENVTNKNLFVLDFFGQYINKSLLNFTLNSKTENHQINATPYSYNDKNQIVFGVVGQTFMEDIYNLNISSENSYVIIENVLNLINKTKPTVFPKFSHLLDIENNENLTYKNEKLNKTNNISAVFNISEDQRNFFNYYKIIYPHCDINNCNNTECLSTSDGYKCFMNCTLNIYNKFTGQAILVYDYCGNETKIETEFIIEKIESGFGGVGFGRWLILNKIFLFILIIFII